MANKRIKALPKALEDEGILFIKNYPKCGTFFIDLRSYVNDVGFWITYPICKHHGYLFYVCPKCGQLHKYINEKGKSGKKTGLDFNHDIKQEVQNIVVVCDGW